MFFYGNDIFLCDEFQKAQGVFKIELEDYRTDLHDFKDVVFIRSSNTELWCRNLIANLFEFHRDKQLVHSFHKNNSNFLYCNEDYYQLTAFTFILKSNFESEVLWEYDILETCNDKTHFLLGVAHNHLFVLTKGNRIIVLNVDDGSLIKTFEWTEPVDGTTYLPGLKEAFLNPEDECIYCLGNYFIKIDTQRLEVLTCRHVSTSFDEMAGITVKNSTLQGRYISFTGWREGYAGRGRMIGLFDIQSEEFVWIDDLSQFIPAFQTPQLAGNRLYILDIENTLHIFERDSLT